MNHVSRNKLPGGKPLTTTTTKAAAVQQCSSAAVLLLAVDLLICVDLCRYSVHAHRTPCTLQL